MTAASALQFETLEKELILTRIFDAPRKLVWKAWTDPQMLARWWGPHGFTNPVCKVDLRVGGKMEITMKGTDGSEFPVIGIYREIVPQEKIVWTDCAGESDAWGEGGPPPDSEVTTLFEDLGGKTKLTLITHFRSNADRDAVLEMGVIDGWTQSYERLEAVLAAK